MATSYKHRREQRDKVLLAAHKCFLRHGFHATGMAEIAKACRMSVGNIYHYFPNKNAIVRTITNEARTRITPVLRRLESHADPIEGVVQIILFGVRDSCCESDARLWMEISAEAPRNKLIRDICLTFDRDFRDVLESLARRAMRDGQLSPALDLKALSLWLVALLDGAIARLSLQPDLDITRTLNTLAYTIRHFLRAAQA